MELLFSIQNRKVSEQLKNSTEYSSKFSDGYLEKERLPYYLAMAAMYEETKRVPCKGLIWSHPVGSNRVEDVFDGKFQENRGLISEYMEEDDVLIIFKKNEKELLYSDYYGFSDIMYEGPNENSSLLEEMRGVLTKDKNLFLQAVFPSLIETEVLSVLTVDEVENSEEFIEKLTEEKRKN